MIELLRQIIRIPSVSFSEDDRCTFLQNALAELGLPCTRVGNNLISLSADSDPKKPILALDAHIDTVAASELYSRNPFDTGSDSQIICGLGSNDDGGSVVCMIYTFRHFFNQPLPVRLMLVLSCEEERSGSNGAAYLYSKDGYFAQQGILPSWVIIGEPTSMRAATSERGLMVIDGIARGVSSHVAHSGGVNALYIALDDIAKIRELDFNRISPTMGKISCKVTQIEAGKSHNVIPEQCHFVIDIRSTEQYTHSEILQMLQSICTSELAARNLNNRASATPQDSLLLRTAQELKIETYSSPTTSNWIKIDCPAIKMGPGDSSRSHKADEYILAEELEDGLNGYIDFIQKFCDGYTLE